MRRVALALALAVSGCAGTAAIPQAAAPAPLFRPEQFFVGHLHGDGRLKIVFKSAETTSVESAGHLAPDGTIVLGQDVREGDKPVRHREWRIRALGDGRYGGTLTDATGPVTGIVRGNELRLAFAMKGGTHAEQRLYLSADGRSARNRLIVTKLGIPVATLDESIVKRD